VTNKLAAMRATLIAILALALLAACGGGEEALPTAEEVVGTVETGETTVETETEAETQTQAETETAIEPETTAETQTETGGGGGGGAGNPEAGREIFASAGCSGCHTLAAANASGTIGPNLDEARPSADEAVQVISNGRGGMPSFRGRLSDAEIRNVAAFVAENAGS
jgi:mono/diheme cytochrome c family protein